MPIDALIDRDWLPDPLLRFGIRQQLAARLNEESRGGEEAVRERRRELLEELGRGPIAIETGAANDQHYEVEPDFYAAVLGPWRKYSCGLWEPEGDDLESSERRMLAACAKRARIEDGQRILDLGCGWGSLSLYLGQRFPEARILAISNSEAQVATVNDRAREQQLANVRAERHDVNDFVPEQRFDRVVSIEMFEHMRNWRALLTRIAGWLRPSGLAFVHHFAHRELVYRYVAEGGGSWMARHFFTGGIMPSADLLENFDEHMRVVDGWEVNGRHYQRTCEAWLAKMDGDRRAVEEVLARAYGPREAALRRHRWRVFFLACAELFGYRGGDEWFVVHRLLAPRADGGTASG